MTNSARRFLFLQGPHGPFFHRLAQRLRKAGAEALRVGFNAGDRAFWPHPASYLGFRDTPKAWPGWLRAVLADHQITDIVLYGDTRPVHVQAIEIARAQGLTVHVFEEGYLRPYWVTYERGGANGHSRLMDLSVPQMRAALAQSGRDLPEPPAVWGDMRQHIFYGAAYHWCVLFLNRGYPAFKPHRPDTLWSEARNYSARLLSIPTTALRRLRVSRRIKRSGAPYHLALMQLSHDSNFVDHGPFADTQAFCDTLIESFAIHAPKHHDLVFKAHPLSCTLRDDAQIVRRSARAHGVSRRVHFVPGGKLAYLLEQAHSALTVTSTAAQQVLWRGIPLKAFGRAVYSKPEFTPDTPLDLFFRDPPRPDQRAYRDYRQFLLETSQVPGGFYSRRGRRRLLRSVVDKMLAAQDPYDALLTRPPEAPQKLRVIPSAPQ